MEEEFTCGETGVSDTAEVKCDVKPKVGLGWIKQFKLEKSIPSGENSIRKCTEMSKYRGFLEIRSHSMSLEYQKEEMMTRRRKKEDCVRNEIGTRPERVLKAEKFYFILEIMRNQ